MWTAVIIFLSLVDCGVLGYLLYAIKHDSPKLNSKKSR